MTNTFTFREFVEKKDREGLKQLKTLQKVLQHAGFKVESYLGNDEDAYIFVFSGNKELSFEGVRIYKIADQITYRVQKEKDTHPFGKAYVLEVESIYNDFISENGDEAKSGEKVIKDITHQLKKFFEKSLAAEKEIRYLTIDADSPTKDGSSGFFDYSSTIGTLR